MKITPVASSRSINQSPSPTPLEPEVLLFVIIILLFCIIDNTITLCYGVYFQVISKYYLNNLISKF